MKRNVLICLISLLSNCLIAQQSNTFLRFHQLNDENLKFLDGYVVNDGEKYVILAETRGGLASNASFLHIEYDSSGTLLDYSYYPHEADHYGVHMGLLHHHFFKNRELFLNYYMGGTFTRYSYFLDKNRNVIWKNSPSFLIEGMKQIRDSTFIGINVIKDSSYLCSMDYFGNITWQINEKTYRIKNPNYYTEPHLSFIDTIILVAAINPYDLNVIYTAQFSLSGKILKRDSIRFNNLASLIDDHDGFIAYCTKWDKQIGSRYHLFKFDADNNIQYELESNDSHSTYIENIFSNDNYTGILVNHSRDLSTAYNQYELIRINKNGQEESRINFNLLNTQIYIEKIIPLPNGGYFIIANHYDDFQNKYAGVLMKSDSTGYIKGATYTSIKNSGTKILDILVFPNPLTTTTTFTLPTLPGQKAEFRLYNITGKLVKQEAFTGNSFQLKRGKLPIGMYLYHFSVGEKVFTGKVLVK